MKKKTLEEAYFHIHNGGMTLRIVEKDSSWESARYDKNTTDLKPIGKKTIIKRGWFLEGRLTNFSPGISIRLPLSHIPMVEWVRDALSRLIERIKVSEGDPNVDIHDNFWVQYSNESPWVPGWAKIRRRSGQDVDLPVPGTEEETFASVPSQASST